MRTKNIDVYVGLFLISASTLLLEILQMRVLSIIMFPGLVYIIITFALLGFGISGALLAVLPVLRRSDYRVLLSKLCGFYALSIFVGVLFAGRFPVATFTGLAREPAHLVAFFLNGIFFATPFVFSGLCIGRAFMEREQQINVPYFLNLAGSGVGCALFPIAVRVVGGPGAIVCAAAIGILAGAFFIRQRSARAFAPLVGFSCVLIAIGAVGADKILRINAGPAKELVRYQDKKRYPDAKVEWDFWSTVCRTDIVGSTHYGAELPDGSKVPMKVVTIDGAAMTWMWGRLTEAQRQACREDYRFMRSFRMLAYLTKKNPDVLLIGVGGGNDVLNAELQEANSITGIDINEGVIRAMKGPYREFTGGLYTDGPARIVVGEGRNFVRHTDRKYDIIHMHGVDTFAALASGAYMFSENYLYTVDAFEDYLGRLNEDGILSATRLSLYPPRETLRLFATALDALERLGAAEPFRHIIILGDSYDGVWATLLCKRSAFTEEEVARYEEICRRLPYVRYWIPDSDLIQPKLRDGRQNFYYTFEQSARAGKREDLFRDYEYEISSTTDDRPFFYKSFRYRGLFRRKKDGPGTEGPFGSWALLGLVVFATEAFVGIVALIFFPLLRFKRDGLGVKGAARYATYFCCLGVAFILIEITLMQRLSLFLGHPTYSVSVVLFCLLVFSGLGSLVSGRLAAHPASVVKRSVPLLVLTALVLNFAVLPTVTHHTLGVSLPIRVLITVLLIMPLAFLMGMPFPSGLRIVKSNEAVQFIPWAWGVNGAASVLGSVASMVLAMAIGFSAITALAALIYLVGMIALVSGRGRAEPGETGGA